MDTGRTTMMMFAAAAAIMVVQRFVNREQGGLPAESGRSSGCDGRHARQQLELRHGQHELRAGQAQLNAALRRVETMSAELLRMGEEFMSHHYQQMRAVADAYEAAATPTEELRRGPRLHQIRGSG